MIGRYFVFSLIFFLNGLVFGQTSRIPRADLIIRHVNVIPVVKEIVLPNQIVVIDRDRIVLLAEDNFPEQLKTKAKIIDGKGKYLMPGLSDMHAHLPDEHDAFSMKEYLLMNLMNGVTSVRQMRGNYANLELKKKIEAGEVLGCHLYVSTPYFWDGKVFTEKNAKDSLERYRAKGFDFVKYLYGLSEKQYDTLLETARALNYKVAGHVAQGGLKQAVDRGQLSIEHIEPFLNLYQKDTASYFEVLDQMKEKGTFACPDVFWYVAEGFHTRLEEKESYLNKEFISPKAIEDWNADFNEDYLVRMKKDPLAFAGKIEGDKHKVETFLRLLPGLQKKGVRLLISPGAGPFIQPGFSMKEEMKLFSRTGLSNYEILKCATLNAAQFLGLEKTNGTLEAGKRADLVLLNANPLEKIENVGEVEGVVIFNAYHSLREMTEALKK
jgi:imidazolonepropionase-like amidohydrolase